MSRRCNGCGWREGNPDIDRAGLGFAFLIEVNFRIADHTHMRMQMAEIRAAKQSDEARMSETVPSNGLRAP